MAYRVEFSARAKRDLADIYISKDASESEPAARWYERLVTSIRSLSEQPSRCPVAPEARTARLDLRHLLYGKKPRIYRIIYEIDEYRNIVRILTIRHTARARDCARPTWHNFEQIDDPLVSGRSTADATPSRKATPPADFPKMNHLPEKHIQ